MTVWHYAGVTWVLPVAALLAAPALAVDPDRVPSEERLIGDNPDQRYFFIPAAAADLPDGGHPLLVILPGGDGSADFLPFVKRIARAALPDTYVVAQPVAVQWTPQQRIVWPTKNLKTEGQRFSTEEFIDAVIADVMDMTPIDPQRVFLMGWSSSGPAVYAASLQEQTAVTGSYIAMSVFKPRDLPPLDRAQGQLFFIEHSPEDRVCPIRMARDAEKRLADAGGVVMFNTYEGGHGWRGDVYGRIGVAMEWLDAHRE